MYTTINNHRIAAHEVRWVNYAAPRRSGRRMAFIARIGRVIALAKRSRFIW